VLVYHAGRPTPACLRRAAGHQAEATMRVGDVLVLGPWGGPSEPAPTARDFAYELVDMRVACAAPLPRP
jgi:hypothetical protein